jgi:NADPH2:quinone reductase
MSEHHGARHGPALVVTRHGGSEVLAVEDRAATEPGPGQVLVEVAAVGVNFIDVYQREGVYPGDPPFVLCSEGAGRVLAAAADADGFTAGDRVGWAMVNGTGARYATLDAARLVPVPDAVDLEVAAAVLLQGMTAQYLVTSTYPVEAGTVAVVHAAAGGVGQLLVQMLHARGARVIATAGGPEKCATARRRGADHVIDYRATDDLAGALREAVGGSGAHVVYDGVGRDTFDASLGALRPRGTMVLFGASSGQVPPFDIQRLNSGGSLFLTRPSLGHYVATPDELRWRADEVLTAVADGSLHVEVGGRYPLADAARAYDDLEGRRTQGKLVLVP